MKGLFITLEGNEGSGKSLHARLLCNYLKKDGRKVLLTREPGKTKIGKSIRRLLLNPKNKILGITTELFLYLADRSQHVAEVVGPYLGKGYIVLCDRFSDATVAYQGYGRRLPINLIHALNRLATKGIRPDLTILLDVPVKLGLKRAKKVGPYGGDRMEREKLQFHKKVHSGYLELAKKEPDRIKIIKVKGSIDATQNEIRKLINRYM